MAESSGRRRGSGAWYLLFVVQLVAVLWPPFYNRVEPRLAGIPFFYWYQLLWVIIGAVLTAIVYLATERGGDAAADGRRPNGSGTQSLGKQSPGQ